MQESQYNLSGIIQYGGCAFLIGWFLLFFSGEIWGLDFDPAAELVVTLSLTSIASCFFTLVALNIIGRKRPLLAKAGGVKYLVFGAILCAGTVGITLGHTVPLLLIASCVAVGISGAFFICATILQLARLRPRNILITCGGVFLVGIMVYSFAFYVPRELTNIILWALPLLASLFYAFDKGEQVVHVQDASVSAGSEKPASGMRTVVLLSLFILFSCVVRGYLPFYIDNEYFSYLRSFSIVGMLVMAAIAVIVPAVLPEKYQLSVLYRAIYIIGVVLFALFPIFGLDNPVVLILEDGFRGLCAIVSLSFFACMARQVPFFGFKNVGGGLAVCIACGFIGWLAGLVLHDANLSADVLRIYCSVQCVIVLLAFIILYRQPEMERFVDVALQPVDGRETNVPVYESSVPVPESGGGRWRQKMLAIAKEKALTSREEEVFILLAKGYKAQNISEKLSISYNTTRAHIRNIYQKCDVHSQQEFIDLLEEEVEE